MLRALVQSEKDIVDGSLSQKEVSLSYKNEIRIRKTPLHS